MKTNQSEPIQSDDDYTELNVNELAKIGPKLGIYNNFRITQGVFFPPYEKVTSHFMREVMDGTKMVSDSTDFTQLFRLFVTMKSELFAALILMDYGKRTFGKSLRDRPGSRLTSLIKSQSAPNGHAKQ